MNVDVRELGERTADVARTLGEHAAHLAVEAWEHRPDLVDELADRARDLEVPDPIDKAIDRTVDSMRRRPWPLLAGLGAVIVAVIVGRVWWRHRAERRQLAHLRADDPRRDPFGSDARYQERAVAAVS